MRKTGQKLTSILLGFDILTLNLSIFLTLCIKEGFFVLTETNELLFLIYNAIYIITVLHYDKNVILKRRLAFQRVIFQVKSSLFQLAIISVVILLFKLTYLSRGVLFGTLLVFLVLRIITGFVLFHLLAILRRRGRALKNIVVLGSNGITEHIQSYCEQHQYLGYNIVGVIHVDLDDKNFVINRAEIMSNLLNVLENKYVNEIIINIPMTEPEIINQIVGIADNNGKRVRLVPDYYRVLKDQYKTGVFADIPVINVREIPLDNIIQSYLKRSFDFVFSGIVMVLLSPLFLSLAFLVKVTSAGPIFYNPIRVGINGKTFKMYKFRSMFKGEDQGDESKSTTMNDPRITRVGSILRKYSLDELPQFMNVFLGQMSVVGPRPHRVWLNEKLKREVQNYMVRHYLRPGITGWAQVNGWRGPTATEEEKFQRTRHDIWYLENWSFLLDLKIIFFTVFGKKASKNAF